jgi:hypothetical protein
VGPDNKTNVDVLSLDNFRTTLDARLDEAHSVQTNLTQLVREKPPKLGTLPDAAYVSDRYLTLYEQYHDRVGALIRAIAATRMAITTIIDNYRTTEARLAADAADIADLLRDVSASSVRAQGLGGGAPGGGHANAG